MSQSEGDAKGLFKQNIFLWLSFLFLKQNHSPTPCRSLQGSELTEVGGGWWKGELYIWFVWVFLPCRGKRTPTADSSMPKQSWHITSINADNLKFDVNIIFTRQEGFVLPYFILQILMHVNICVSYGHEHIQITEERTTWTVSYQTIKELKFPPLQPLSIRHDFNTAVCKQTTDYTSNFKI